MASRAQKTRLAVFLLVSCGVLILLLFFVAGRNILKAREAYFVEFEKSVGGLRRGDLVKYQGINVGRVDNLSISPADRSVIVVKISVESGKIPNVMRADTRARLQTLGITGLKYIELVAGSADSPPLAPNSTIQAAETFLSNIDERAQILTFKVEQLIENLTELTGRENSLQLNRMLSAGGDFTAHANAVMGDNRMHVDDSFRNLSAMTESLAGAAASLHVTMDSLNAMLTDGNVRATLSDFRLATRAARVQLDGPVPDLLANLNRMAGNIDTTFTRIDLTVRQSRQSILDAVQDLEETLINVREATELIREDPSILIRGRADE